MTTRKSRAATRKAKTIRCAIYTRKSTDEGLDNGFSSLDAQREACEAYVQSQVGVGWVCLEDPYDDGGFSAGTMDRPALRRLLTEVEAGQVDTIVVYKLDRLTRSLLDFVRIVEVLDRHNVSFVSITQQFATNTSMGRLTLNMLLSFAQFERDIISERTADKMGAARRKGKWTGGIPILGYDIDPGGQGLVVNEEEAGRVREIFAVYQDRRSVVETTREVNRRGWRTKKWTTKGGKERGGTPFDKNTLFTLLGNATYVGKVRYRGETFDGEHDGIVDRKVWERVQKLLHRNGSTPGGSRNKTGSLLKGLLWCGSCEERMLPVYTKKSNGARYRYYVCQAARARGWNSCPTKSIPAPEIERFIIDRIKAIGADPKLRAEVIKKVQAEVRKRADALDRERRGIEKDLRRYAAEVKRIVGPGKETKSRQSTATAQLADLQDRIGAAEQRLVEIRKEQAAVEGDRVDERDMATALEEFAPVWDALVPREQARIVHLLVERIEYDGEKEAVTVTFRPGGIKALTQEVTE